MIRLVSPYFLPIFLLTLSGGVSAIGLGELRGQPMLGDRLRLEVDLLGAEKQTLEPSCFRLVQPAGGGDIPWLKQASFSIRKAAKPVLQIRSEVPLREPILQLAVEVGCGHDIARDYMILAAPEKFDLSPPVVQAPVVQAGRAPADVLPRAAKPKPRPAMPDVTSDVPRRAPEKKIKRSALHRLSDQVLLSNNSDAGEPALRLSPELASLGGAELYEAQRDILRLEYRMLAALHEQVTTQMATAEKLRNMEAVLGDLQQKTSEFAQRVEPVVSSVPSPVAPAPAPAVAPAVVSPKPAPPPPVDDSFSLSEWSIYGGLLGAFLGIGGWLAWRKYREREVWSVEDQHLSEPADFEVDAKRSDEYEEPGGIDLPVEPTQMGQAMQVDLELDGGDSPVSSLDDDVSVKPSRAVDSLMSISATTVDEHFEANPVMELADIMLSFGRVKGAAQALQEYIDNSPQEALQPWIRLLEVYRMAEMRAEFESLATNLNQNFNVAIPSWDPERSKTGPSEVDLVLDGELPVEVVTPQSIEDMPRIVSTVCELWPSGDVIPYLQQLLRDNRGGKRAGFALPVVEEILFLVELKECVNRME